MSQKSLLSRICRRLNEEHHEDLPPDEIPFVGFSEDIERFMSVDVNEFVDMHFVPSQGAFPWDDREFINCTPPSTLLKTQVIRRHEH